MSFMTAFGTASIMLCLGVFLRAKVKLFQNMLMPAPVIAGVIGFVVMNIFYSYNIDIGFGSQMFTDIVNNLFTLSFISITLTDTSSEGNSNAKGSVINGAVALGIIWCLLYSLTPLIATAIVAVLGKSADMQPIYGMLVQFAFCQGPGQSVAYGEIFEQFGWANATTVAVTYSAIGFVAAFLVGVPAAKLGIQRGIAKHSGKLDQRIMKGYLNREEQTELMVKDTTCNSNIETLTYHFALIGVCYVLAAAIGKLFSLIPGFMGQSLSSMMFMNGMYAAYIVKAIMKKLKLDFLRDNVLQNKITGWTSDYLVVCSFMAISVSLIKQWLPIILVVSIIITLVTFVVCFYFGRRIGGDNDFERTLGIYGTCTGTVPSGISLVRIVDPDFKTSTGVELGACNLVMLASTPVYIIVLALASGTIRIAVAMGGLLACTLLYAVILKVTRSWGKTTYNWK